MLIQATNTDALLDMKFKKT